MRQAVDVVATGALVGASPLVASESLFTAPANQKNARCSSSARPRAPYPSSSFERTTRMTRIVVSLCLVAAACARGGSQTPSEPTIEELRKRAGDDPRDAEAWRELAVAELFREDGDPARVKDAVAHALELDPGNARLHLVAGTEAFLHGRPDEALESLLVSFERAAGDDPPTAEVALGSLAELSELASGFDDAVRTRVAAALPRTTIGARAVAASLLIDQQYRMGDVEAVKATAATAGCIDRWRVAGPFGPRDLLGFDQTFPAAGRGPMASEYDLGEGRGVRQTRELWSRGCDVHLGEGPLAEGGTTYAEAMVEVAEGGSYTLRLETPNSVKLSVDGEEIVAIDMRRQPLQRTTFHQLELGAGTHEIEVKITTRHPNPILNVALLPGTPNTAVPAGDSMDCFVRAAMRLERGFPIGARTALDSRECRASVPVTLLRAAVALVDPYVTSDMRRDHARRLMSKVLEKDPRSWFPALQLARLKAAEGRDQEAIADLRAALERWPDLISFRLALVELLLNRGWDAEAERHIEAALQIAPGNCTPVGVALAHAQRRDRIDRIDTYVDRLMECNARSTARFGQLINARRWDDAVAELDRIAALEPPQARARLLASRIQLTEGQANPAATEAVLRELIGERPQSATYRLELADQLLARGQMPQALSVLDRAIEAEPTAMIELRRIRSALGGKDEIAPFRQDGSAILEEYRSSGVAYDEPTVLVFDYTAVRVFEDGSSLVLTHQIYHAKSEESVDQLGQFTPPDSGYVLNLRTIKADGTRLEPDLMGNMNTINLPLVAVGDFVEHEYVRVLGPPRGLPGGILGERFYFASFETPFYRSEEVVATPASMPIVVDPRGGAPEAKREERGGLVIHRWRVDQSDALVREPLSVAPREYIPSIQWGHGASWGLFLEGLRDLMADRNPVDPAALALARRITHGAETDEAKAKLLYYWVLDNVENNNDVFGVAPTMLSRRTGNRTRVLHYLLGLLGVRTSLVLVRDFSADQMQSDLADDGTYGNLVLKIGDRYLVTSARGIPFGYISPTLRGQDALVLLPYDRSDEVRKVTLPPEPEGSEKRSIEILADIASDGSARLEVTETFRGLQAIEWRTDLEGVPEAVLEERFEEGYAARVVPGGHLESLRIMGQDDPEQDFVLRYTVRAPSLARQQGGRLVLPGLFPTMLTPRFAQVGERSTTQIVGPTLDIDLAIRIRLEGRAPTSTLAPVELEGPGGARFTARASTTDGALLVRRQVRVPLMRVPPERYPGFAHFVRQVDAAEAREIPLR